MFSCCSGFGTSLGFSGFSSFGVLDTGTVIFSLPGSSALRAGSGILLPPPPPPPPGPGCESQMMSFADMNSEFACGRTTSGMRAIITTASVKRARCTAIDTLRALPVRD
jgi:hypothetical protein